jgi:hypothetical protein
MTTPAPYVVDENVDGLPASVLVIAQGEAEIVVTVEEPMMAVMMMKVIKAMMTTKMTGSKMTAAYVAKLAIAEVTAAHVAKMSASKVAPAHMTASKAPTHMTASKAPTKMATTATTCECVSSHIYTSKGERGGDDDCLA